MNKTQEKGQTRLPFDLENYLLTAATEASNRTRTIMVAMIVASVLALVSVLNTMDFEVPWLSSQRPNSSGTLHLKSWKLGRLEALGDPNSEYANRKICPPAKKCALIKGLISDKPEPSAQKPEPSAQDPCPPSSNQFIGNDDADLRYRQFYTAAARDYVDTAFTVRVPFFGVTFDVNDVGLLMGVGFVSILLVLRFSIRSEIISLRVAFKNAKQGTSYDRSTFYDLLAMRQVFTLPRLKDELLSGAHHGKERWSSHDPTWNVWVLRFTQKVICLLPLLIYSVVTWHDIESTRDWGNSIDPDHFWVLRFYTLGLELIILTLTVWCLWKLLEIDLIWDSYWAEVSNESAGKLHGLYIKWKRRRAKQSLPRA